MPKPKKKDSPVGTPITTPTNSPERSSLDNSFAPLQSESDGEEEKSIDTINAEETHLEIESEHSDYTDAAEDAQAPRTPPAQTKPVATPDVPSERPTSHIANIPPTDLERLKESIPLFASDLAKSAGKLFTDDQESQPGSPAQDPTLKPPPVASIPKARSTPPRPDKFAHSLYFNSGRARQFERELPVESFEDDTKPPAVGTRVNQGSQFLRPIQANMIAEHEKIEASKGHPTERYAGKVDSADVNSARAITEKTVEEDRKLATEIFGSDKSSAMEMDPQEIVQDKSAAPMDIDLASSSKQGKKPDVIEQLNESIERNKQSLQKLEDMLRIAKEDQSRVSTMQQAPVQIAASSIPSASNVYQPRNSNPGPQQDKSPQDVQGLSSTMPDTAAPRDPFTQLATLKPNYPKLPEPSPKRLLFYRATWRIHIPNDMESPVNGLIDGISEIWAVLKSVDDKIIIYPWQQSNHGRYKALSGPSNFRKQRKGSIDTSRMLIFDHTPAQCISTYMWGPTYLSKI
jgi:hypothetical protein